MFKLTEEQFDECEQAEREKHEEKVRELAEQRAEQRTEIFQQSMESCHSNNPIDCIEWFADRIIELEAENEQIKNSDTLCKVIGEQKLQIEKMKCLLNELYSEFGFSELVKVRNDLPIEIQEVIKEIKEND